MAAISLFDSKGMGSSFLIREAAAQADTGQTDWIGVPDWATGVQIYFNLTAVAGTTPIVTPSFLVLPPGVRDDTDSLVLVAGAATPAAITVASQHVYDIARTGSSKSGDTDSATADAYVSINAQLAPVLGIKLLMDRTSSNETYSYTLRAFFRGQR